MKKLFSFALVLILLLSTAFASAPDPFTLISSIRLIESTLGGDLFTVTSDNPDIQAFIDGTRSDVDAYYESLGFERNSVTEFMDNLFCLPLTTSDFSLINTNVCAYYVFANEFAACRSGNQSECALLYTYSNDGSYQTCDDVGLQMYFEQLRAYLDESYVSIVQDGVIAGADALYVVIDIVSSTSYERAVYDLVAGECTIRNMD